MMGSLTRDFFTRREADMWLNDPAVREALHAAPKSMTGPWQLCSSRIHYRSDGGSMLPVHNDLVRKHGEFIRHQGPSSNPQAMPEGT